MENIRLQKLLICLLLVLAAVISFFPLGNMASSTDKHSNEIAKLDEKIETVLKLSASATAVSVGVTMLPDDTATPIAEKLADFTSYFLVILTVLYAEKYLITILGFGAFKIIIPAAAALCILAVAFAQKGMGKLSLKLVLFALALYFAIPLGLTVSDKVYDTYQTSINETIESAELISSETDEYSEQKTGIISALSNLSETASNLLQRATSIINNYVESIAVLIVTSCVIPLLVVIFMIWVAKMLLGVDITLMHIPAPGKRRMF